MTPRLTVRAIRAVAVKVPMTYVLGTSAQAVREAPLLLVDLETEEGVTGHAYQFCYLPAAAPAMVSGRPGNGLGWNEDAVRRFRMA